MKLKTAIIGLGKQSVEDHLPAALESSNFDVVAVCDVDQTRTQEISKKYSIEGFDNLNTLLQSMKIDVAIVAVPHDKYLEIVTQLAKAKVHIIKEKPFAINKEEALRIHEVVSRNDVLLGVTLQRRFNPIFQAFHQLKKRIGKIYSIEGRYVMNIAKLDEGWRSSHQIAGGGVLIDMGYHFVDLLVWYMGLPTSVTARISRGNRLGQLYDVEDTANLLFDYSYGKNHEEKTVGNFVISRVYPKKEESLTFFGTNGIIMIQRGQIQRLDCNGDEIEKLSRVGGWPSAAVDQLDYFARKIHDRKERGIDQYLEHFKHIAIIEAAYESDRLSNSQNPHAFIPDMKSAQGD